MPSKEPTLDDKRKLPASYKFIPSGNVYITKNCRALAHEAGRTLYIVRNSKKHICGIGAPIYICKLVQRLDAETREQRKAAVEKKDTALSKKVKVELLNTFLYIPQERVGQILHHMLKKRSGRVGRSRDIDLRRTVILGAVAHIRHKLTRYDQLLEKGISRAEARIQVQHEIDEVLRTWGLAHSKPQNAKQSSEAGGKLPLRLRVSPASISKR